MTRHCLLCFFALLSILFNNASANEATVTPEKLHISSLREYMASNRFFDRIRPVTSEDSVETTVRASRSEAQRHFNWIKREYPLYTSLPYLAFYSTLFIGGVVSSRYHQSIANYFQNSSPMVHLAGVSVASAGLGVTMVSVAPFLMNTYYGIFAPSLPERNLVLNYGAKKHFLDERTQHYIEDELFYSFWRSPSSEALNRLQKILDKALRLPFYSKELTFNEDKIDNALQFYPAEVAEQLKQFAYSELIYQQTDRTLRDSHYPVYFFGEPGTGKTFAAKQLAEAMGTNLAVVTLDGATIDDIVGTPFESIDAKAGRILDALVARTSSSQDINHHNQILLIDEFDRLFLSGNEKTKDVLSFMLKLLDPANRSFYNPYLKTDIRLPDTIILAGNQDIHELSAHDSELKAIASRLDKVTFPGFDREAKRTIADHVMIPGKVKLYQSGGGSLSLFTLPARGHEMIMEFIDEDQDPGLRSLEKYVAKVFEQFVRGVAPRSKVTSH